jgi:D-alanyl-D-alanine carboxypeptidase (penicillin-binding protein 5/6)
MAYIKKINLQKLKSLITYVFLVFSIIYSCDTKVKATVFTPDIQTKTQSVLLYNSDTDTIVYQKNSSQKMFPASLTKIMTYIIAVESISDLDNTLITIEKEQLDILKGTGSSLSGLKPGKILTAKQLLMGMMISSGNDAAFILSHYCSKGNISEFVQKMNNKALELGCQNTHFVNSHGLHDEEHFTTAEDLLKIVNYSRSLQYFTEITSKATAPTEEGKYPLVTTNFMIDPNRGGQYYYKYANGIKTGHTDEAGHCIAASAKKENNNYICIAMGSNDPKTNYAMIDSKNLFEWAFNNLKIKPVIDKTKPIGETSLNFAWNKDRIQLVPAKDYSVVLPKNVEASSIDISLNVPKSVDAPLSVGDKIGTATLSYANQTLSTIDVVSAQAVERNQIAYFFDMTKRIVSSKWFIISSILILILIFSCVISAHIHNKKRKIIRMRHNRRK